MVQILLDQKNCKQIAKQDRCIKVIFNIVLSKKKIFKKQISTVYKNKIKYDEYNGTIMFYKQTRH